MGWWSVTILGGDTPLDYLLLVETILGVDELYPTDTWDEEKRKQVRESCDKILTDEFLQETFENRDVEYQGHIFVQVLALIVMAAGAHMSDYLRADAVAACDGDSWAQDDAEREEVVQEFKQQIEQYRDGNAVVTTEEGLMEKLVDHIIDLDSKSSDEGE